MSLVLYNPIDNGASLITGYELWIEDGTGYVQVGTYDGVSLNKNLNDVLDSLTVGDKYYFKFRAVNAIGYSEFSNEVAFALADLPAQPSTPFKVDSESTPTSISVHWNSVADTDIVTSGYRLYMDGGNNGEYTLIYNGEGSPGKLSYLAQGLDKGFAYRFKVEALNFNGAGTESDEAILYACLPPSGLLPPTYVSSTETDLDLAWKAPSDNNGCPVFEYELFINDGLGGAITTSVGTFSPHELTTSISLTGADTGNTFFVQLEAKSNAGSTLSG